MKELSIKQKAKAYDNVLEKIQKLINNAKKQGHIIVRVEDIENSFPELKESENEKVIKCVKYAIDRLFLKEKIVGDVHKDDVLAWFERQCQINSLHENKMCKENDDYLTNKIEPKFKVDN